MTLPFARTVCACTECVNCCKTRPGMLMPDDLEPILLTLMQQGRAANVTEALAFLRASPGATALRAIHGGFEIVQIPTIVPRTTDGHRCVFLNEQDRCDIHAVAPSGCRFFDTHQSAKEAQTRSALIHHLIMESEMYYEIRNLLDPA